MPYTKSTVFVLLDSRYQKPPTFGRSKNHFRIGFCMGVPFHVERGSQDEAGNPSGRAVCMGLGAADAGGRKRARRFRCRYRQTLHTSPSPKATTRLLGQSAVRADAAASAAWSISGGAGAPSPGDC